MSYLFCVISIWFSCAVVMGLFGGTHVSVFLSIGGTAALLMHAVFFGRSHG